MSEPRLGASRTQQPSERLESDERVADFTALRSETARNLPSLNETVLKVRRPHRSWEEYVMATIGILKHRPWMTTAIAGALAAVALLVIPFGYERTTGHDVALTVSGTNVGQDQVLGIATELEGLLHVEHVMVRAEVENGQPSFVLDAIVPSKTGVDAEAVAHAFEAELTKAGYTASTAITPIKQRVSGTLYAYARDRVIEINTDGKSAAQLEAEIRQRLADAGVTNVKVSVTDPNGDQSKVNVKVEARRHEGQPAGEGLPELVLKRGGAPEAGEAFSIRVERRKYQTGGTTLLVRAEQGEKKATAEVPNSESMSDTALAAEIQSQLDRAGLAVVVKVSNGEVEIERRQKP